MTQAIITKVDNLLNTCGTGGANKKTVKGWITGIIKDTEADGNPFTELELQLMLHSYCEGYEAALKSK